MFHPTAWSLSSRFGAPWRPLAGALALLAGAAAAADGQVVNIVQHARAFNVASVEIAAGDTLRFTNDDDFLHQIYVKSDRFNFESAEQQPGQTVEVRFPVAGRFAVQCQIHPKMYLDVTVK